MNNRNKKLVDLSRCLSWILRHGIIDLKLDMDAEGYVLLDDVMQVKDVKKFSVNDVISVVSSNGKERFKLITVDGNLYIRANQGHSKKVGELISDEKMLKKIEKPLDICIHGTNEKAYEIIKTKGLSKMGRKHIHLATGLPSANVKSGIRKSASVIIHINMKNAMQNGITFYMSDNGVVLTSDDIPPEYFDKVTYR